ncbi:transcription elongation factor GreA [Erysipelothrix rhusiopathiae]|uniref:transcription elongation factor GreA n=1 Tax=Erysipelothrix rhusiopathiae TaxID=1648 RepID=UPI00295315D4|nr:transcription elongation factor GreA [Erysipelothrix rhusiopathiae]MDV7679475.1 transcription elongation factor GreA [Erysipelothrix rhusiopathiae]
MTERIPVTQAGLDELNRELRQLIEVERPEVIEDLKAARAQGDLSENADYDAARDRQARVEARIREIEATLTKVEIIDGDKAKKHKPVGLGATVTIYDMEMEIEETFSIVGSVEADPENGKLSNVSPLAQAMNEAKEGDVVEVQVDEPYEVKVLKIN